MKTITRKKSFSIAVSIIGIIFMVIGVYRGEALTVLQKAVKICMECIGIG